MIEIEKQIEIVTSISKAISLKQAGLHEPEFKGNEFRYVEDCLKSTFVSSVGAYVNRFEEAICKYTKVKYAVAVVNGTSALHTALVLSGVQPGDEVLVPALTFIATANAVTYCGATPHFIDSNEENLGIDAEKLREYLKTIAVSKNGLTINKKSGKVIRAIIPVHVFGHPCDIDEILTIANDYGLVIIEDAAESLGSTYKGKHTGNFGLMGVLSFNGNKIVTTGGGGAIMTNDEKIAERATHITKTSRISSKWDFVHDEVGFNYRMPNLNAALGLGQIEGIDEKVTKKRELFRKYQIAISGIDGVRMLEEPKTSKSNYWLQAIILENSSPENLDSMLNLFNNQGISARPVWRLLPLQTPYMKCQSDDISQALRISKKVINIPSSPSLAD
jgi:perosamine synthetase